MAKENDTDKPLVLLEDKNSDCLSVLATMELSDYMDLVRSAYKDRGGLEGQRAPITTKTGLKIRSRLVQDLKNGAVIPPIVVGAVCKPAVVTGLKRLKESSQLVDLLRQRKVELSIIDGMQRTTALLDAKLRPETPVRVELWVANKVDSLIYRMLVLNTGQVPWDLKRQLDTLYRPIVETVEQQIPQARIIGLDESFRRSQAGEYRSTRIIELFLAFTSRSVDVDVRERVAEEFARIDITEATAHAEFMPLFLEALKLMISVDGAFDKNTRGAKLQEDVKVKSGRDIFTSAPGSIGFMAAVAEIIMGAPGFDYDLVDAKKELAKLKRNVESLVKFLKPLTPKQLAEFLDISTLNQVLGVKSSRIGEYQRNFYKRAFTVLLIKTSQVIKQGSLTPCWSAR